MRLNYIGIVAGIIAFISLTLPWWTLTMYPHFRYARIMKISVEVSVYPYQAKTLTTGVPQDVMQREGASEPWFGLATLVLIITAGIAGIVGSVIIGKTGKIILIVAGILALLSIITFAAGLQNELSKEAPMPDFPELSLFSSGVYSVMGVLSMDYSTYLNSGFWLALFAAIIAFISSIKHPVAHRQLRRQQSSDDGASGGI